MPTAAVQRAIERVEAEGRELARHWVLDRAQGFSGMRRSERREVVAMALATRGVASELASSRLLRPTHDALGDELGADRYDVPTFAWVHGRGVGAFRREVERRIAEMFPPPPPPGASRPPRSLADALSRPRGGPRRAGPGG
ncbi:MAG: hypothetical protein AB7I38_16785 [Dehalococcoidia bacterium]